MAKQQETPDRGRQDVVQLMGEISEKSKQLLRDLAERESVNGASTADPLNLGSTVLELTARILTNPAAVAHAQLSLWQGYLQLWQATSQQLLGRDVPPVIEPERGDRRFRDPAWGDNAVFDFIKQSYLLTSRWLVETVNRLDGADEKTRQKIDFYTRQFVDAMAPSNFVATNP
jgi:polyhydroxyalkanoate synthase